MHMRAACPCRLSLLHVLSPCCMSMLCFMLHVHAAGLCCISLLLAHATYPFCMTMLYVNVRAACSCLCRMSVSMLHVCIRAACPCLCAACPCSCWVYAVFYAAFTYPFCLYMLHAHSMPYVYVHVLAALSDDRFGSDIVKKKWSVKKFWAGIDIVEWSRGWNRHFRMIGWKLKGWNRHCQMIG